MAVIYNSDKYAMPFAHQGSKHIINEYMKRRNDGEAEHYSGSGTLRA